MAGRRANHQQQVHYLAAVRADGILLNSSSKHQYHNYIQQRFGAGRSMNTATAESPARCMRFNRQPDKFEEKLNKMKQLILAILTLIYSENLYCQSTTIKTIEQAKILKKQVDSLTIISNELEQRNAVYSEIRKVKVILEEKKKELETFNKYNLHELINDGYSFIDKAINDAYKDVGKMNFLNVAMEQIEGRTVRLYGFYGEIELDLVVDGSDSKEIENYVSNSNVHVNRHIPYLFKSIDFIDTSIFYLDRNYKVIFTQNAIRLGNSLLKNDLSRISEFRCKLYYDSEFHRMSQILIHNNGDYKYIYRPFVNTNLIRYVTLEGVLNFENGNLHLNDWTLVK